MRTVRRVGRWILGAELLLLVACAAPQPRGPAPDRVQLEVPYYSDAGPRRAAASLAEVLTFWDQYTEPKDLSPQVRLDGFARTAKDPLPAALLLAAQDRGMQARSFQATPQDVRNELKLGHPVVAYLNTGGRIFPEERFVVITGFDDGRGGFFVNASGRRQFVAYGPFMSRWEKTGRWALLVLPAGEPAMSDRSARSGL
jgi:hypothetical protein